MATGGKIIRVVIKAEDQVTAVFKKMQKQLDNLERLANSTNNSINRMTRSTTTQYSQISSNISSATRSQHNLNNAISNGLSPAKALTDTIKTLAATYLGLNVAESMIKTSDMVTLTTARLDLFNDSLRTTEQQTDAIYQAAQRARGSYLEMVDLVSKYSAVAGDSFSSTDDIVAFTEILQKMFTVSGATGQEIYSASLQLKQALGTGRLMGEEFRAIMESAPLFGQAIAEYMTEIGKWGEVGIGDLKELASQSQITTDIMIGAMFRASDDINAKFEDMPYTFNQVWTKMKNTVVKSLDSVWKKLTSLLSNGDLDKFFTAFGNVIVVVATILVHIFTLVVNVFNAIAENWSYVAPIIWGIIAALVAYRAGLFLVNTINAIAATLEATKAAATAMSAGATFTATAAQYGYNAALYACPIVWIIVLIIAIIALIYLLIQTIVDCTGLTTSATEIIMGAIYALTAGAWNAFVALWNGIMSLLDGIINPILSVIEFILNACQGGFDSFGDGVANLIGNIISWFLELGKVVTTIIDAIFGTDWTAGLKNLQNKVTSWGKNENAITLEKNYASKLSLDRASYGAAWNKGKGVGASIDKTVGSVFDSLDDVSKLINSDYDWNDLANKYGDPLSNIADDVSNIANGVNITNEDLKYLRQLAERRTVNRFTTAEIKIDMNNSNTITGTQDIDGIVKSLEEKLYESMSVAAEGVHI